MNETLMLESPKYEKTVPRITTKPSHDINVAYHCVSWCIRPIEKMEH